MKIHIPNSAFLGNIDAFIKLVDFSNPEEIYITANEKWMSVHPVVLCMIASLGVKVCAESSKQRPILSKSAMVGWKKAAFWTEYTRPWFPVSTSNLPSTHRRGWKIADQAQPGLSGPPSRTNILKWWSVAYNRERAHAGDS